MNGDVAQKILENLPKAAAPVGNYLAWTCSGDTVIISGQICIKEGEVVYKGKALKDYSIQEAILAARLCGINVLSQLREACAGSLERVERCVEINVFINSDTELTEHAKIANGASDLMFEFFGEKGKHVRTAVGCPSLPLNSLVEVRGVFELKKNER